MTQQLARQRRRSLTSRLVVAFVSTAVILLLIVGVALILVSRNVQTQQVLQVEQKTADEVALTISSYVVNAQSALRIVARTQNLLALDTAVQRGVLQLLLVGQEGTLEEITLLNTAGQEMVRESPFHTFLPAELTNQAGTAQFQEAVQGKMYVAREANNSAYSSLPVVTIAVPVLDKRGAAAGVLAGELSLKAMWDAVARVKAGQTGYAYIVDQQTSQIIGHTSVGRYFQLQGQRLDNIPVVRQIMAGAGSLPDPYSGLEGSEVIGAYTPIAGTNWAVVVELPVSEAFASLQQMIYLLVAILVAGVLAAGTTGILLPRRIVQPLRLLRDGAATIGAGNLESSIQIHTNDELQDLAEAFNTMAAGLKESQAELEQWSRELEVKIEARTAQLQASADVGRAITSTLDQNELLHKVVDLITSQFGFYYAAVFLLDDSGKFAELREATGEAGKILKERGHKLEVGGQSMVGDVTAHRKPRIALDTGDEAVRFANPLLPETRSEIALPLVVGDRVLGALDVQSQQAAAFEEASIAVLQGMADQVAVAIENARSFERQAVLAEQNRQLLERSEKAIEELNSLTRRLTGEAWEKYFTTQAGGLTVTAAPLGQEVSIQSGHSLMTLPIALRGEAIGTIDLGDLAPDRQWNEDEIGLAKDVANRLALALDNARLFETAQKNAHELAALNELSRALAVRLEESQILQEVYRSASQLMNTNNFFVALCDPKKNEVRFPLDMSEGQAAAVVTIPLSTASLTAHIIRTQQPLLLKENVAAWKAAHGIVDAGQRFGAQSWLGVPLIVSGQVLGVMAVESYTESFVFTEHDRDLLMAIASQTAVALQNARLLEQTQQAAERERTINRITGRIRSARSVDEVLTVATQELRLATQASRSVVDIAPHTAKPASADFSPASGNGGQPRS